jgi:hypothetical protein
MNLTEHPCWIESKWSTPANIHAGISTRLEGNSLAPYDSLNLGAHVGDDPLTVEKNRTRLSRILELPTEPCWLQQEHGNRIINLDQVEMIDKKDDQQDNIADGVFTSKPGVVCGVMTADCLPILISNNTGTEIAALHGGWRGLADGIIQKAMPMFSCPPQSLMVWLGPAISARNYEIGLEVKTAFDDITNLLQGDTFIPTRKGHWLVSLYRIAMTILKSLGVENIHGGQYCTYRDADLFYSHRRDTNNTNNDLKSANTGRMASLIWMDP